MSMHATERPHVEFDEEVDAGAGDVMLPGRLVVPANAIGVVLFAHGSGSSRHSPRNIFVAEALQRGQIATLLFDLLTRAEEAVDIQTAEFRFNIDFLAQRVAATTHWLMAHAMVRGLPVGYFGASTGAASALVAAAKLPRNVAAVVSRGGRPDLAGDALPDVQAPTLLIVGGRDPQVITLNQHALAKMTCTKELVLVPGAMHLFEEPGALERVARLARAWFLRYLPGTPARPRLVQRTEDQGCQGAVPPRGRGIREESL